MSQLLEEPIVKSLKYEVVYTDRLAGLLVLDLEDIGEYERKDFDKLKSVKYGGGILGEDYGAVVLYNEYLDTSSYSAFINSLTQYAQEGHPIAYYMRVFTYSRSHAKGKSLSYNVTLGRVRKEDFDNLVFMDEDQDKFYINGNNADKFHSLGFDYEPVAQNININSFSECDRYVFNNKIHRMNQESINTLLSNAKEKAEDVNVRFRPHYRGRYENFCIKLYPNADEWFEIVKRAKDLEQINNKHIHRKWTDYLKDATLMYLSPYQFTKKDMDD